MSSLQSFTALVLGTAFLPIFLVFIGMADVRDGVAYEKGLNQIRKRGITLLTIGVMLGIAYTLTLSRINHGWMVVMGYWAIATIVATLDAYGMVLSQYRRIRVKVRDWRIQDHWLGLMSLAALAMFTYPIWGLIQDLIAEILSFLVTVWVPGIYRWVLDGLAKFVATFGLETSVAITLPWLLIAWLAWVRFHLTGKVTKLQKEVETQRGMVESLKGAFQALTEYVKTGKQSGVAQEFRELLEYIQPDRVFFVPAYWREVTQRFRTDREARRKARKQQVSNGV